MTRIRVADTLGPICSRGKGASYSQLDIAAAAAFVEPAAKNYPINLEVCGSGRGSKGLRYSTGQTQD